MISIKEKLSKKLKSNKGETLVEVLVTILLVGLVSAGFLVVVQTAQSIDANVAEIDDTFYEEISKAESIVSSSTDIEDGQVELRITQSDDATLMTGPSIKLDVDAFNGSYNLHSYKVK